MASAGPVKSAVRGRRAMVKTRAEHFSGDWWKVVPVEPLTPGEYAVVIESNSQETNSDVWDFGVER